MGAKGSAGKEARQRALIRPPRLALPAGSGQGKAGKSGGENEAKAEAKQGFFLTDLCGGTTSQEVALRAELETALRFPSEGPPGLALPLLVPVNSVTEAEESVMEPAPLLDPQLLPPPRDERPGAARGGARGSQGQTTVKPAVAPEKTEGGVGVPPAWRSLLSSLNVSTSETNSGSKQSDERWGGSSQPIPRTIDRDST